MAPTLVAGRVSELLLFAQEQQEIVLKPLGGRAGLGVIRVNGQAPGLKALLELVTEQESLPVMAQAVSELGEIAFEVGEIQQGLGPDQPLTLSAQ